MNLALLAGTINRPLDLRTSSKGKPWGSLLLDTGDGDRHRVTLFGELAEAVARFPVGAPLFVRGRIQNSTWEAADGSKRYGTAIIASEAEPIAEDTLAAVARLVGGRRAAAVCGVAALLTVLAAHIASASAGSIVPSGSLRMRPSFTARLTAWRVPPVRPLAARCLAYSAPVTPTSSSVNPQ